jgi:hypothetical protein
VAGIRKGDDIVEIKSIFLSVAGSHVGRTEQELSRAACALHNFGGDDLSLFVAPRIVT